MYYLKPCWSATWLCGKLRRSSCIRGTARGQSRFHLCFLKCESNSSSVKPTWCASSNFIHLDVHFVLFCQLSQLQHQIRITADSKSWCDYGKN